MFATPPRSLGGRVSSSPLHILAVPLLVIACIGVGFVLVALAGVLIPEDVTRSRFSGDGYSFETKPDFEAMDAMRAQEEAQAAAFAARAAQAPPPGTVPPAGDAVPPTGEQTPPPGSESK